MSVRSARPVGNCARCHRADVTSRVIIGRFERLVCRMCAETYRRTPGVAVEIQVLPD
jgi:hypothetical protein